MGERTTRVIDRKASYAELRALLDRIETAYRPSDVLLYGSKVTGAAHEFSDWDILVVLPDGADEKLLDPVLGWQVQAGSGVHADISCCFRSEFVADLEVANSRAMEIKDHAVSIVAG